MELAPRWVSVVHKGTWPCLARAAACLALDRLRGRRRETLGLAADDHAFQGARSFACYHIFVQRNIVVGKARLRLAHLFGACCCRLRCSSRPSVAQARGRSRRAPHRASCSAASLPASLPHTHAASRRRRHVPSPGRALSACTRASSTHVRRSASVNLRANLVHMCSHIISVCITYHGMLDRINK